MTVGGVRAVVDELQRFALREGAQLRLLTTTFTRTTDSVTRPSGRRYVESPGNGWTFYLFGRTAPGAAFAFLGPIRYAHHTGDRPIAITWQLASPMPAFLYDRDATLRPT